MSAQKQCPKCGEKNPAEAVMCWACYTSLSGGVAAPVGLATTGAPSAAMADSGEKKKIAPQQMAIGGVVLVVLLGVGAKMMMGSGEQPSDVMPMTNANNGKKPGIIPVATTPPPSNLGGSSVQMGSAAPGAPTNVQVPQRFPYQLLGAPDPRSPTATVAIVPTENDLSEGQAKGLAVFAHRQLSKVKKWSAVEIFVFNDVSAAQSFANYQNQHRGAPLVETDYTSGELTGLWPKAIVRYYSRNDRVWISSPRTNASTFWKSGSAAS